MTLVPSVMRFVDKKLAQYGRHFDVVRPASAADPLANNLGSALAYIYRNPKGHGDADWLMMIGEGLAKPGDYLVREGETYIYGLKPFMLPAQAMRCNHTIAVLRAPARAAVGAQGYGGLCIAEGTVALGALNLDRSLATGWPCSILIGGRQGIGAHLPMSVANGGFEVMLPKTVPITLRASDVLLDNLGRRFVADTCEFSELGWRLAVKESHP